MRATTSPAVRDGHQDRPPVRIANRNPGRGEFGNNRFDPLRAYLHAGIFRDDPADENQTFLPARADLIAHILDGLPLAHFAGNDGIDAG